MGWLEKVHPEDCQTVVNGLIQAVAAREQFTLQFRVLMHGGDYAWVTSGGSPATSPQTGALIGYLGLIKPIEGHPRMLTVLCDVGSARPPARILNGSKHATLAHLSDELIYARKLARQAKEHATHNILELALEEVGFRLAESRADERNNRDDAGVAH